MTKFFSWLLLLTATNAIASTKDLVFYDDTDQSIFGFSIQTPANQTEEWIMIASCNGVGGIDQLTQCQQPAKPLILVSEFKHAVMSTVLRWADEHPHKELYPLSVDDIEVLKKINANRANGAAAVLQKKVDDLATQLANAKSLIDHVPDSAIYQKQYSDLNDQMSGLLQDQQKFNLAQQNGAQAESVLDAIADSVLLLIRKNDSKTQKIHSMAYSLNKNTLADEVIHDLAVGQGVYEQLTFKTEYDGCISAFEHAATIQGYNDRYELCKNLPNGTAACLFRFVQQDGMLSAARVDTCKNGGN
jgi:hypothetical protein